ncbi:MAG: YbgC/FadM family acyl-CoA thioesterase [Polyangiaceae bacterium]|nr:YbgC/FadM family acyl-CoA thioesterase [Polyangiaceae bacterium]
MPRPHVHPVQIYYEDTDHSGVVYHANYLKYFERAREHLLGVEELVSLYRDQGIGFVVYKAELVYREGAVFGDSLEVHTVPHKESEYRIRFQQDILRAGRPQKLVEGRVDLVCVNREKQLVPLPQQVLAGLSF